MDSRNRDDPYVRLAHAIVKQAVKDYRRAKHNLRRNRRDAEAKQTYEETIEFFRSDWFRILCDLEPEDLIRRMEETF